MNNPISVSTLNDFIFCPASIYYHRFYNEIEKTNYQRIYQVKGTNSHKSIDNNKYSTRKNIITSLTCYSEEYNLICKIDTYYADEKRLVERKKKIIKIYDGYVFQLYGQYFALKECGYDVNKIELYSLDDNKKHNLLLPEEDEIMFAKFLRVINDINNFEILNFKAENVEKCSKCIYSPACAFTLSKDDHD